MPITESISTLCALLAACLLIAVTTQRFWKELGQGRDSIRRVMMVIGWLLLILAVASFRLSFGWEIGLAWFILWLSIAAIVATLWLSLWPKTVLWAGPSLSVVALATWIL